MNNPYTYCNTSIPKKEIKNTGFSNEISKNPVTFLLYAFCRGNFIINRLFV